jgi:hypothetical protein
MLGVKGRLYRNPRLYCSGGRLGLGRADKPPHRAPLYGEAHPETCINLDANHKFQIMVGSQQSRVKIHGPVCSDMSAAGPTLCS